MGATGSRKEDEVINNGTDRECSEYIKPAHKSDASDLRGFLILECANCGKRNAFCARKPLEKYFCRSCRQDTPLGDGIHAAYVNCPNCGQRFKYKTNIQAEVIDFACLNCGEPVALEWNFMRTTHITRGRTDRL